MSVMSNRVFYGANFSDSYNGDGAGVYNISRSNIDPAASNTVVVNDGTGLMSSFLQLPPSYGGIGIDTSGSTGIARVTGGVWSIGPISPGDIGVVLQPDSVAVTDSGSNLTTVLALDSSRGGTGQDFSAVGAGPFIITNSGGVMSSDLIYSTADTADTVVQRDSVGGVAVQAVSTPSITSPGDLTLSPTGNVIMTTDVVMNAVIYNGGLPGGQTIQRTVNVVTVGTVTEDILFLPTSSGPSGTSYYLKSEITAGSGADGLLFSIFNRGKNLLGATTVQNSIIVAQSTDAGLSTATVTVLASGINIIVRVNGVAGKTINWCGHFTVISQTF